MFRTHGGGDDVGAKMICCKYPKPQSDIREVRKGARTRVVCNETVAINHNAPRRDLVFKQITKRLQRRGIRFMGCGYMNAQRGRQDAIYENSEIMNVRRVVEAVP